eukprot:5512063-Pleurochrysis_carterae.AAC.1
MEATRLAASLAPGGRCELPSRDFEPESRWELGPAGARAAAFGVREGGGASTGLGGDVGKMRGSMQSVGRGQGGAFGVAAQQRARKSV